jgi:transcriptional regulator with XRE-family HTH domain
MTIRQYRGRLGWSLSELARRAGLTQQTVARVEKGESAHTRTMVAIARALSEALGEEITPDDLKGTAASL